MREYNASAWQWGRCYSGTRDGAQADGEGEGEERSAHEGCASSRALDEEGEGEDRGAQSRAHEGGAHEEVAEGVFEVAEYPDDRVRVTPADATASLYD